jgi:hypothetical protein
MTEGIIEVIKIMKEKVTEMMREEMTDMIIEIEMTEDSVEEMIKEITDKMTEEKIDKMTERMTVIEEMTVTEGMTVIEEMITEISGETLEQKKEKEKDITPHTKNEWHMKTTKENC